MHSNGCISSNLSDVFPSIPLQDSTANASINNHLLNMNGMPTMRGTDVGSSMKYLDVNIPPHMGNPPSTNGFFNEDRSRTNLIINYLPQSFDQNDLQRLFEHVGPIRQCKLIRDKANGASLCYGFVDFINPQHAALAIQTYHGYETEQKRLRVAYASSGGRRFTAAGTNAEVTNENIIGWEVFATGIPIDWTEPELLKLFNNFGTVILLRLLAPQLSESPPSHRPRLTSPSLNGCSNELNSESVDNRLTTNASIIFDEKTSAEFSVNRLNGYQAPDWSVPLRLRIIGSVTRETYGMFCMPSRQSPALSFSRIPNGLNAVDPLSESEVLNNLLNRRVLSSSNAAVHGSFTKIGDSTCSATQGDIHANPFAMHPRAIIRNKVNESAAILGQSGLSHGQALELLDFMENQTNAPSTNSVDSFTNRELSLIHNLTTARNVDQENSKLDISLRNITGNQNSTWSFPQHRSVLSTLPESGRSADVQTQRLSVKSPLIPSSILSSIASQRGCQAQIWLKLENIQPTGSFKIRGMENACRKWASSGVTHVFCPGECNAAISAAYAAHAYGLGCTVVIPQTSEPEVRRRLLLEAPDTNVVIYGSDWLEAHHKAEQLLNEFQTNRPVTTTARLLHPYDLPELWEGYESIIEEITPEIGQPDVIVVAVGGGGLLAGVIQGLWNRGWSSTHVVAVETEETDCLNRSLKSNQLMLAPRSTTIASSLKAHVLAQRTWNLAQLQSLSPLICSDADAVDAVRRFLDDHGMLVEPACGAALSTIYSGALGRLQLEGRIPRPANVIVIVAGGCNVSMRQLLEWESQVNTYDVDHASAPFLPPITNSFLNSSSPHSILCPELSSKPSAFGQQMSSDSEETIKLGSSAPNTPRAVCSVLGRTSNTASASTTTTDRDENEEGIGSILNRNDLMNFSKLLAPSDGDEVSTQE